MKVVVIVLLAVAVTVAAATDKALQQQNNTPGKASKVERVMRAVEDHCEVRRSSKLFS